MFFWTRDLAKRSSSYPVVLLVFEGMGLVLSNSAAFLEIGSGLRSIFLSSYNKSSPELLLSCYKISTLKLGIRCFVTGSS